MIFSLLQEYQQIVDAEWEILYDKLDKIVKSGAKVVLSKLPIGDVATQYFADRLDFLLSLFPLWNASLKYTLLSINPFHANISMHILHTVLYTFPKELTTTPLFSWPSSLI